MRRLGPRIAVSAAIVLAAGACSASHPASTKPAAGPRATATSTTETVRIGRLTEIFPDPLPANPAAAAVVKDFRESQIAWQKSDNAFSVVSPASQYVTGIAYLHLLAGINGEKQNGDVYGGTDRLYVTGASALTARSASVSVCDDGGKAAQENARTGRPDLRYPTLAGKQYLRMTCCLTREPGNWAVSDLHHHLVRQR